MSLKSKTPEEIENESSHLRELISFLHRHGVILLSTQDGMSKQKLTEIFNEVDEHVLARLTDKIFYLDNLSSDENLKHELRGIGVDRGY